MKLVFGWSAVLLAISAASAVASENEAYDDPAVAICEYDLHEGRTPPETYSRESSEIEGKTVTIRYSIQVLNMKPKQDQFTCDFILNESGYLIWGPLTEEAGYCLEHIPALREELKGYKPGSSRYADIHIQIDRCVSVLEPIRDREMKRARYMVRLLNAGVYPIDPKETKLGAR